MKCKGSAEKKASPTKEQGIDGQEIKDVESEQQSPAKVLKRKIEEDEEEQHPVEKRVPLKFKIPKELNQLLKKNLRSDSKLTCNLQLSSLEDLENRRHFMFFCLF